MSFNKGDKVLMQKNGSTYNGKTGFVLNILKNQNYDVSFGEKTITCKAEFLKKIDSTCDSSAIVVVSSPVAHQSFKDALAKPKYECNFEDFLNGDCGEDNDYDDGDCDLYISKLEEDNAALQQQNDALIEQIQDMHHMQKSESSSKNSEQNQTEVFKKLTETGAKLYETEKENTVLKAALAAMEAKFAAMESRLQAKTAECAELRKLRYNAQPFVPGNN